MSSEEKEVEVNGKITAGDQTASFTKQKVRKTQLRRGK